MRHSCVYYILRALCSCLLPARPTWPDCQWADPSEPLPARLTWTEFVRLWGGGGGGGVLRWSRALRKDIESRNIKNWIKITKILRSNVAYYICQYVRTSFPTSQYILMHHNQTIHGLYWSVCLGLGLKLTRNKYLFHQEHEITMETYGMISSNGGRHNKQPT